MKKAIIPVAGLGTRFLPATKAQPKEMLNLVDKPLIQYIVEEAVASGITDIIFVTSQAKRSIEDHFDRNFELEYRLKQKQENETLEMIMQLSDLANFIYVRQKTPLGDGHAVLSAANLVQDEPVAVLFGDDLIDNHVPALKQLIPVYQEYLDPVIAVSPVPQNQVSHYGIIKGLKIDKKVYQIKGLIEKPKVEKTPSNLAIVGRYILTPEVLKVLAQAKPSVGGEIRLIDGFRQLLKTRSIYACELEGTWYDCGNKLNFLKATVNWGLKHKELKKPFTQYLKKLDI